MTTSTTYHERYTSLRNGLRQLDPATLAASVGTGLVDQVQAAGRDTQADLHRVADVARTIDPERRWSGVQESDDQNLVTDVTARVLAAMGDGRWVFCCHLKRTPSQPATVKLPLRRVDCRRCTTVRKPPPDEDDRCDLCGTREVATFWPVCFALSTWLVVGDICRDCMTALDLSGGKAMTEAATEPRPCRFKGCAFLTRRADGLCAGHAADIERGVADPGQLEQPEGES